LAKQVVEILYKVDSSQIEKANQIMGRTDDTTGKADNAVKGFGKDAKKAGADTEKAFKGANDSVNKLGKSASAQKKPFIDLSSIVSKLTIAAAATFIAGKVIDIGSEVIKTTSEFQKFEAVLTNTLGSNSAAQVAIAKIVDFASKTPFSVNELTESFVKLANQGFVPTTKQLRQLGDLASSTGKSFDQLTEALIDAQTGEFERLKEFGIRASKEGDKVRFTFKGVQTQVDFTNASIQKYILGLGDLQGVSGSMAAISTTLGGKISNLGDSYDQLLLSLGALTGGPINFLIDELADLVNITRLLITSNEELAKQKHLKTVAKEAEEVSERYNALVEDNIRLGQARADAEANAFNQIKEDLTANIALEKQRIETLADDAWNETDEKRQKALVREYEDQKALLDIDQARLEALKKISKGNDDKYSKERGLLEQLRASLKSVQEQREKETDEKQILSINKRIKFYNDEIKRLEELGKEAEKTRNKLKELFPLDSLEESGKKLKAIQKAAFGDSDSLIKNQTDKFIEGIDEQIKARSAQADFEEKKRQEALQKEKEYRKNQRQMFFESFNVAADLLNNISALESQKTLNKISSIEKEKQIQIAAAGDNSKARIQIEADYDKRLLALKKQQFNRDKNLAKVNAFINIAQGATKALAEGGFAGILLAALVAAAGAVQIRAIDKQQFQFNKGVKSVPGPHTNRDSVSAMLTPGEMVIPLPTKKKYQPILNSIFDHKISPELLNNIAKGKGSEGGVMVINDNKDVVNAIEGLPINNFNWDEDGVTKYVEKKGSRTQYLNRRFKVK
jgi:hypothetical protein